MAKNKKNSGIIIIILIAILLVGFAVFTVKSIYDNSFEENMVEIPRLETYIKSSNDNSSHHIVAEFYVEVPGKFKEKISTSEIHASMLKVLQEIDYDSLKEKGGLDKVIKTMEEDLRNLYPDISIDNIYVKNFLTDFSLPEPSNTKSKDERIKMFQIN